MDDAVEYVVDPPRRKSRQQLASLFDRSIRGLLKRGDDFLARHSGHGFCDFGEQLGGTDVAMVTIAERGDMRFVRGG
jgi:hypothetical protein